ncbi:hypothetical protein ACUHGC_03930 [Testudinibacter sp. P27/CKL/0425]
MNSSYKRYLNEKVAKGRKDIAEKKTASWQEAVNFARQALLNNHQQIKRSA